MTIESLQDQLKARLTSIKGQAMVNLVPEVGRFVREHGEKEVASAIAALGKDGIALEIALDRHLNGFVSKAA